jgi:hypothetical protein
VKVKERKTDKLFSDYIRARDGWRCLACGEISKDYRQNKQGLHCSHYWGRGHENTRFDPENCIALCWYHHHFSWGHGDGRQEYTDFMKRRLGEEGFNLLDVRAHTYKKRDDKMDLIVIRELLKEVT